MSKDITAILTEWDFEPDDIHVRIVPGDDGRDKVQLRVELGLLQMEIDGRPDGARPEQFESWLEYYEEMQRIHDSAHAGETRFTLEEQDCVRLWREGVQYYHRYLSFWHLASYALCARDTARNLRLFAFVRAHASQDRYKLQFDQWRPYVTMMHARASATPLLAEHKFAEALRLIESGIDGIRDFLEEYQQSHRAAECNELTDLERWRDETLVQQAHAEGPHGENAIQALRRRLEEAVKREEFEKAAQLRDEIRRWEGGQST